MTHRICGLIPCYNHHQTVGAVAHRLRDELGAVIIVDDGSGPETQRRLAELEADGFEVVTRAENGGKGAACKSGFRAADELGFTHAFQVDADGQHDLARVADFAAYSGQHPDYLVLGCPEFDDTAPLVRRLGRKITQFWTHVETAGPTIVDPMCGFRVYPVTQALASGTRGDHMQFDIEIAVRMVRMGVPVHNMDVHVRYLDEDDGGLSNFRMLQDNLLITATHIRLVVSVLPWLIGVGSPQGRLT